MACTYINLDDAQSFIQDVESMMDEANPSLLRTPSCPNSRTQSRKNSDRSLKSNQFQSASTPLDLISLERGGVICQTKIGPIQFGLPPETVKDSLNLGIEVPTYYIIPTKRFDKKYGISVAEFEFPAYFNFFVKQKQIVLICTAQDEKSIRIVFQETLLGPVDHSNIQQDFYYKYRKDCWPDFFKELSIFSKNPKNLSERLSIDHLLRFVLFDEQTNIATIQEKDQTIQIIKKDGYFKILENDFLLHQIKDNVVFPSEYNEYIQIKNFDEFKVEAMPQVYPPRDVDVTPRFRIKEALSPKNVSLLPAQTLEEKLNQVIKERQDDELQDEEVKEKDNDQATTTFDGRDNKKKTSILLWTEGGQAHIESAQNLFDYQEENTTFTPPDFGVTVLGCSHGFDPKGSTSGYIFWIHGKGIMVDPPPFASYHMRQMGIPSIYICAVIISHCHADHDAGIFHKILDDTRVEIITTRTIMNSFLRKYEAISGMSQKELQRLFIFRPVLIGTSLNIYGATFEFFYAMHTIPSLGFTVQLQNKSIYFSSDTFYDPAKLLEYKEQGILSELRYQQLAFPKFTQDIILHEAGVPPIHTPQSVLAALPVDVKNRLYLVHTAEKDLLKDSGLKIAKTGIENTMILIPSNTNKQISTIRRLDLLSSIDIFEHLTIKNIRWLLDTLELEEFNAGEYIVREGSLGNKFYIIESGLAKVFSSQKGNEFERYYQVGDYFGESAVITNQGRRGANVQAVTCVRTLSLEKHDFWFIFGDGYDGQGPIIEKMRQLTNARKSKSIHVLFKNSVLSELTPGQKTQLEMILSQQEIQQGEVVWKAGNKAEFAILVKKGSFEFFDCPEESIDELDSGAYIGEVKAMCQETPLTTNLRATKQSIVFKITKADLVNFLQHNPGLYLLFKDLKYID